MPTGPSNPSSSRPSRVPASAFRSRSASSRLSMPRRRSPAHKRRTPVFEHNSGEIRGVCGSPLRHISRQEIKKPFKKMLIHNYFLNVVFSIILYIIGALCCAYYDYLIEVKWIVKLIIHPDFNTFRRIFLMGVPFFGLGYIIDRLKVGLIVMEGRKRFAILIFLILLYLSEMMMVRLLSCYDNIILTLFLYPLVACIMSILLIYPLSNYIQLGLYSRITSQYMYYFHPLLLFLVSGIKALPNTFLFLITIAFFLLVGYFLFYIKSYKIIQKIKIILDNIK